MGRKPAEQPGQSDFKIVSAPHMTPYGSLPGPQFSLTVGASHGVGNAVSKNRRRVLFESNENLPEEAKL